MYIFMPCVSPRPRQPSAYSFMDVIIENCPCCLKSDINIL